jgi:hypothetical protein
MSIERQVLSEFLALLAKELLPGSAEMNIPEAGAGEVNSILNDANSVGEVVDILGKLDPSLDLNATQVDGAGLASELLKVLSQQPALYSQMSRAIAGPLLTSHYQRADVLQGLGLDNRAPFPHGNLVKQSDLSMLEPVYERGPIYREFESE